MSERDAAGLSRLDADRAHSMADEGGVSAASVDAAGECCEAWRGVATGIACVVGFAAGAGLIRLWRSR